MPTRITPLAQQTIICTTLFLACFHTSNVLSSQLWASRNISLTQRSGQCMWRRSRKVCPRPHHQRRLQRHQHLSLRVPLLHKRVTLPPRRRHNRTCIKLDTSWQHRKYITYNRRGAPTNALSCVMGYVRGGRGAAISCLFRPHS